MNNTVNPENYRKLPITSLVAGILAFAIFLIPQIMMGPSYYRITGIERLMFSFSIFGILVTGLSVTTIACGSIDLNRIRKGLHSSKVFKGFDIAGIALGSIIFLFIASSRCNPVAEDRHSITGSLP